MKPVGRQHGHEICQQLALARSRLMNQRIYPHLGSDPGHLDDRRAMELEIKSVAVGEEEMRTENEVEVIVGKRQLWKRAWPISGGTSDDVRPEAARGLSPDAPMARGV